MSLKPFVLSGPTLTPNGQIVNSSLSLSDGKISRISPQMDMAADFTTEGIIVPGFIEMQINGGFGFDFTQDASTVADVAKRLPETGTTAFLPTLITSEFSTYPQRLEDIRRSLHPELSRADFIQAEIEGKPNRARVLGVHLEGPFIDSLRRGAHLAQFLRKIDLEQIAAWADPDLVRLVTLAAELPGGLEAVKLLRERGILVSIGHTDATYDQAQQAFAAGIGWATHLFNGMRPIHHREPGIIGALLASSIPCGIIADGIHVHPSLVGLAYQLKGSANLVLVSDAMAALGMAPGTYQLGEGVVTVSEKDARMEGGVLAGSLLRMDHAIRNLMNFSGCSLADAVQCATLTPARLLGIDDHFGKIEPGYNADLVVLDSAYQVSHTFIAGHCVYSR